MNLPIIQVGEPVLRGRARMLSAEEIRGAEIQQLIEDMRESMRAAPGVGLAAPQVGRDVQLAVIEDRAEYHEKLSPEQLAARGRVPVEFYALANPEIVWRSEENATFFEGCLSVAGLCALVPRALKVRVRFLDATGVPQSLEAIGWHARIIQHELDHLQGTLYIDRMLSRTFTSVENLGRHWKDLTADEVIRRLR
jgi:peptide deformylase